MRPQRQTDTGGVQWKGGVINVCNDTAWILTAVCCAVRSNTEVHQTCSLILLRYTSNTWNIQQNPCSSFEIIRCRSDNTETSKSFLFLVSLSRFATGFKTKTKQGNRRKKNKHICLKLKWKIFYSHLLQDIIRALVWKHKPAQKHTNTQKNNYFHVWTTTEKFTWLQNITIKNVNNKIKICPLANSTRHLTNKKKLK